VTTLPAPDPLAFGELLSRSWALFKRNWIVALPMVIAVGVMIVAFVVFAVIVIATLARSNNFSQLSSRTIAGLVIGYLAFFVVLTVAVWWATVATYGMAHAAWERGTTTFADGFAAFRFRGWQVVVAFIGLVGIGIAAVILALPTLGLALLALPILTMYTLPSVVGGGRGGFEAIGESFRLVRRFFLPSLITVLVLLAIQYGIGMVGGIAIFPLEFSVLPSGHETGLRMPPIPLLVGTGLLYVVSLIAGLAYSGFYAITLVGMYRSLIVQPVPVPVTAATEIATT
jgi:hypothetical protein